RAHVVLIHSRLLVSLGKSALHPPQFPFQIFGARQIYRFLLLQKTLRASYSLTCRLQVRVLCLLNGWCFVAPSLACGESRGSIIPPQWGCDRRATKPQAKLGATQRAAVLFAPGFVAHSLQIH